MADDEYLADGEILKRDVLARVEQTGDGRTLEMRIVPYNVPTTVSDPPYHIPYKEVFVPGVFERQISAPNRVSVFLNVEHEQGIGGVVGRLADGDEVARGRALWEDELGFNGTFRMLDHPDADKALALVNSGDLIGASLEFKATKSVREPSGVVKRMKGQLINVALVRPSGSANGIQAYKEAGVLAVRETPSDDEPTPDEPAPEPDAPRASEADEALLRVGYERVSTIGVTRKPWSSDSERFTEEEYARSCLVAGELPVLEPDGTLNILALAPAAAVLSGARGGLKRISQADRAKGARKLLRYYRQAGETPPDALRRVASS